MQTTAMEAKKLLADENKKQRVKQNKYVSWVLCKVSNRKTLSGEIFCFFGKVCYEYLNCVLRITSCFFMGCWLAYKQLTIVVAL